MKNIIYIILLIAWILSSEKDEAGFFSISRIHYDGGGDWYSNPSSLPNLLDFINQNTSIQVKLSENKVKIGDELFFKNNYFYITGHGNIKFSKNESLILRQHLENGAFLHVDDNYGLDASFRKAAKDLFPDKDLIEIPSSHPIFNCYFIFNNGLPKIHEHDNKPPQAFGIFHNEKLILLYTYESDLGDGWEDKNVHNNPEHIRLEALKMGTNIVIYNLIQ
tara:strand:+ start:1497 stop:2156 length:660 start_codon:yes stop_codon:yes gene_type:complete